MTPEEIVSQENMTGSEFLIIVKNRIGEIECVI